MAIDDEDEVVEYAAGYGAGVKFDGTDAAIAPNTQNKPIHLQ